MAPQPPDPVGLLLAALIATVVVTPVLSLLVLWWYRRAVGRSMRAAARRRPVAPVPVAVPEHAHVRARPAPVIVLDEAHRPGGRGGRPGDGTRDDPWRRARRRLRATVAVYAAAGLAFGLVVAAVWLTAGARRHRTAQPARPDGAVRLAAGPDGARARGGHPGRRRRWPGPVTPRSCCSRRRAPGSRSPGPAPWSGSSSGRLRSCSSRSAAGPSGRSARSSRSRCW